MSWSHASFQTLRQVCLQERHEQQGDSPACVELFRRAFDGSQEAWELIGQLFEPLMRAWVGVQSRIEVDDVIQDALINFYRFAPKCAGLLESGDLAPVLGYLRKATKTALLSGLRAEQRQTYYDPAVQIDMLTDNTEFTAQVELSQLISECTRQSLKTHEERIIFDLYFRCAAKPREILQAHGDMFDNITSINLVIQRLARRFQKLLADQPELGGSLGGDEAPAQAALRLGQPSRGRKSPQIALQMA